MEAFGDAWNTGNLEQLDRICDPNFELRMTPKFEAKVGLDSLKSEITMWRTAYPDFHITIDEVFFSANAAAGRWTITATNTGPGMYPPTGKQVNTPGMSIFHYADGKLMDVWIGGNNLLWMKQLGFSLAPPEFPEAEQPEEP
jgi:predicted ester cyclase